MPGFLDNTTPPLRLAALGFAIALLGALMAFSIEYGPDNSLSYLAFGLGAVGVSLGFLGIAWGWMSAFRSLWARMRK